MRPFGFLLSCVSIGGLLASFTPTAHGDDEICPAAYPIVLDAPETMATLTGDPEMPQYVDGTFVKTVVAGSDLSLIRVGENNWFVGIPDPTGEFFWPIIDAGKDLELSGDGSFDVPGGPPALGHPLAVLDDGWYVVGGLCEGIQCEMQDGSIGGWVPCDDPDVLDAINEYKECVKAAMGIQAIDYAIFLEFIACVIAAGVSGPLAFAVCMAIWAVMIWAQHQSFHKALSDCWKNYAREFRRAMREHCDSLNINYEDIPVPNETSPSPCDIWHQ